MHPSESGGGEAWVCGVGTCNCSEHAGTRECEGTPRIPWALDHAARVQDEDTEDEVVGLVEDWAPGLAAAALVMREQLGWDRTHGVNHDAM